MLARVCLSSWQRLALLFVVMATPGECFFNLFLSQAEVRKLMGKFLFIVLFTHVVVSIYMKIATVGAREIFFSLPSLKN